MSGRSGEVVQGSEVSEKKTCYDRYSSSGAIACSSTSNDALLLAPPQGSQPNITYAALRTHELHAILQDRSHLVSLDRTIKGNFSSYVTISKISLLCLCPPSFRERMYISRSLPSLLLVG